MNDSKEPFMSGVKSGLEKIMDYHKKVLADDRPLKLLIEQLEDDE